MARKDWPVFAIWRADSKSLFVHVNVDRALKELKTQMWMPDVGIKLVSEVSNRSSPLLMPASWMFERIYMPHLYSLLLSPSFHTLSLDLGFTKWSDIHIMFWTTIVWITARNTGLCTWWLAVWWCEKYANISVCREESKQVQARSLGTSG